MMKGEFKCMRNLVERACSEHAFGVQDCHVRVVNSLTSKDLEEIKKTGYLSTDRLSELPENEEAVSYIISLISKWFKALSKSLADLPREELEKRGMKITKINDDMSAVKYDEYF
jgi:CRISPR/Cas system CSM-associated protein Csm4 (group 5 of RAMP superfamily)